jgi:hypothetical protein
MVDLVVWKLLMMPSRRSDREASKSRNCLSDRDLRRDRGRKDKESGPHQRLATSAVGRI